MQSLPLRPNHTLAFEEGEKLTKHKLIYLGKLFVMVLLISVMIVPYRAMGKVQQVTDLEDKLEGISDEEQAVLE
jgi:hypothetical protein